MENLPSFSKKKKLILALFQKEQLKNLILKKDIMK